MWEILSVFACQTLFSLNTLHVPSLFQILVCVHEFSLVAAFSCFGSYNVLYSMCHILIFCYLLFNQVENKTKFRFLFSDDVLSGEGKVLCSGETDHIN